MAEDGPYRTWSGISQAIKTEAARIAKSGQSSLTLNEQILQANHDRFLSRVFADGEESEWLLKGGTAMLARVPKSRSTKDLDLAATTLDDLDAAQDALAAAAERDLGDHITFTLTGARETGQGQNQPGVQTRRLTFTASDQSTGRRLFDVPIDVVVGPPPIGSVTTSDPSNRLNLGRPLTSHPYRLYPLADQIADKVTATMTLYDGRPSSRTKDLVDLVTIARTQHVNLRELQMVIDAKRALSHLAPFTEFTVPDDWERSYRALAAKTLTTQDMLELEEAVALAKRMIDPALAETPASEEIAWVPGHGWTADPAAVTSTADPAGTGEVHVNSHVRASGPVVSHWRRARGTAGSDSD